jgi:broad specificity phosphatase PhoE
MRTLYLIRHGETTWNHEGRLQGQLDVPLSARGEEQARRLARRLADVALDRIYTSPLRRARDTARLCFPERVDAMEELPGFMERHLGELQGLTRPEAELAFPPYRRAGTALLAEAPPGGESLADFVARVMAAFSEVQGTSVAIVAHGGSLSILLAELLGLARGRLRLENASLSILTHAQGVWHARVLDSTAHLL